MRDIPPLRVRWLGTAAPVRHAARELARCLTCMTGRRVRAAYAARYQPATVGTAWIGEPAAFGRHVPRGLAMPHPFDDRVCIRAGAGRALITGANPRSVLLAVCRYLEALGCRWFWPGADGERIPRRPDPLALRVRLDERPAARHRILCIEGACSEEHVLALLDYAVRRGFNGYFVQFRDAFTFFDRWYTHEAPDAGAVRFTSARARRICARIKAAAVRRGLILHTVGHGWTCEPLGLVGNEWAPTRQRVPPAAVPLLAEVRGRRALWGGIPLNTHLCYGRPDVRRLMADAVADYAAAHPAEAVVHVWLADGSNNQCECRTCRRRRPGDWYVLLLNAIDRRLAARGLATRIVFLAYVDLLWAPLTQRLRNPGRFLLMFAPITRSYSRAFRDAAPATGPDDVPQSYRRNRLEFPRSPRANLRLLAGWRRLFRGDCVDFDYHLWTDWRNDPGQLQLARVLHRDVCGLRRLGMNGFISCQNQRPFFPTGIWTELLARGLWAPRVPFARVACDYFADLFGATAGAAVRRHLETISRLFDPPFLRGEKPGAVAAREAARRLRRVPTAVAALRPRVRAGRRCAPDAAGAAAWRRLAAHGWYVQALARLHLARLEGDAVRFARARRNLEAGLRRRLPELHPALDTWTVRQGIDLLAVERRLPAEAEAMEVRPQSSARKGRAGASRRTLLG